jgi:pSer/pThr/pTyr-binding forkhead associated (FHA) protein
MLYWQCYTDIMGFRLRGSLDDRTLAYDLRSGRNLIGSAPACDLRLTDPTISRSHAELRVDGDRVELHDLGSRNGTFVDGNRIARELLPGSAEIAFGRVKLRLEEVQSEDLEMGMGVVLAPARSGAASRSGAAAAAAAPAPVTAPTAVTAIAARTAVQEQAAAAATVSTQALDAFTRGHLPGLLRLVGEGADVTRVAQAGGAALFETLPVVDLEVVAEALGRGGEPTGEAAGLLFAARRQALSAPHAASRAADAAARPAPRPEDGAALTVPCGAGGGLAVRAAFPSGNVARLYRPLVEAVAALVGLAAGRHHAAPPAAASAAAIAALPEPASAVPATQRIAAAAAQASAATSGRTLADALARCERREILQALSAHDGDVVAAAGALGIGRSTLYRRMRALDIEAQRPAGRRTAAGPPA